MLDTLTAIGLGIAIGLPAGWVLRGMRYARRAAADAREARRMIERDDEGRVGFQTAAMAVVVVLALVSTVVSGYAARESNQAADRTREIAKCNQEILERTVEALRQRTAFSDESAAAERKVLHTQSHLVDAMLQPAPSTTTLIGLARKYQSAVDDREDLLQRNKNRRDRFPYPTPEQIQECD